MTFSNCCFIAWYCKRFIVFAVTIGCFFFFSKTTRHWNWKISIRLSSLYIPCCAMSCPVLLQISWNVVLCEMYRKVICYFTDWNTDYSYHGNIFPSGELRSRVTFIPFLLVAPFLCFSLFKMILLTHSSSIHSFPRLKPILRGISF